MNTVPAVEKNKLIEISQGTTLFDNDNTLEKSVDNCTVEAVTLDYSNLSVGHAFNESDIEI